MAYLYLSLESRRCVNSEPHVDRKYSRIDFTFWYVRRMERHTIWEWPTIGKVYLRVLGKNALAIGMRDKTEWLEETWIFF